MKNHDTPTKMALLKRKTKTEDTQPPPRSTEQQAPLHWTNVVEMGREDTVERCVLWNQSRQIKWGLRGH